MRRRREGEGGRGKGGKRRRKRKKEVPLISIQRGYNLLAARAGWEL